MQIEIRLIEKHLQLTKFQYFQRTLLEFNGTVMICVIKVKNTFKKFLKVIFTFIFEKWKISSNYIANIKR